MVWGKIDDAAFEEAEKMIGVPLRRNEWRWFEQASRDGIRHYCVGYGEDNPLYTDPEYAKKTVWGTQLAPPTFVFAIDATTVGPKFAGVQWIYAGCEFARRVARPYDDRATRNPFCVSDDFLKRLGK